MKASLIALLFLGAVATWSMLPNAAGPQSLAADAVVLRVGDFALTKAEYELLLPGFDRASGATTTVSTPESKQTGLEVARLLALVSAARQRKIDQDPKMQALMRVRGYVLLANSLLVELTQEATKDEAATRALWSSEQNNYIEVRARQILFRYRGVKVDKPGMAGVTRTEAEAKALADALFQKLKKGADFAAAAKANSDDEATRSLGGELPVFTRGLMTGAFEAVAFKSPPGEPSAPFKTDYGYHIVQVVDRHPMPFEAVRRSLESIRARKMFEEIATSGVQLNDAYFKP